MTCATAIWPKGSWASPVDSIDCESKLVCLNVLVPQRISAGAHR